MESSRLAAFYARKEAALSAGTTSPRPAAVAPAKPVSAPAQASLPITRAPQVTQADVNRAANMAAAQGRARAEAVYASENSKGRERVCAKLLASPRAFSAQAIIKELGNLPTDRDLAAKARQTATEADAGWDRAYRAAPAKAQSTATASSEADDGWARAYRGTAAKAQETTAAPLPSDDTWARAYAAPRTI